MTTATLDERIAQRRARRIANQQAADAQRQQIEAARKLLKPEEVRDGHIPGWLSKRLTRYCKRHGIETYRCKQTALHYASYAIANAVGIDIGTTTIWDHWGSVRGEHYKCCNEAGVSFVSEPYNFTARTAHFLDAFCKALDLEWHLTPNAWHYPGYTIRIIIHEKQP
jgi:hypothetical protein